MNTHHPSSSVPLVDNQQAAQERLETPEGRREFWRATFSCWLGTTMEYEPPRVSWRVFYL